MSGFSITCVCTRMSCIAPSTNRINNTRGCLFIIYLTRTSKSTSASPSFFYTLSLSTINIINDQCMHTLFPGMCTFTTRKIKRSGTAMTNPVAQMDTKMDLSIKKRRIRARESGGGREKERANKVNIRVNTGGVGGATELLVCALCVQAQSAQLTVCVPNVADQRPMHSPCHVRDSKRGRCRLRAADADERAVSGRQAKHARLRRAARH